MSKPLIIAGIALILIGVAWPLIQRLGLGHLPGDILILRENTVFYSPLTTMILISAVATLILWILRR